MNGNSFLQDMPEAIQKIAKFLDKCLNAEQVARLADHLHIDNFRNNDSVNLSEFEGFMFPNEPQFVRKGKSSLSEWPEEYTPELIKRLEALMEQKLKNISIKFPGC